MWIGRGRRGEEDGPLATEESADSDERGPLFGFQVVALARGGELAQGGEDLRGDGEGGMGGGGEEGKKLSGGHGAAGLGGFPG